MSVEEFSESYFHNLSDRYISNRLNFTLIMIVNIGSRIVMLKMIISAHEFKKKAASSSLVGVYKIL